MAEEHLYSLNVAGVGMCIKSAQPLQITKRFLPFLVRPTDEEYQVVFCKIPFLPEPPGKPVFRNESYEVFSDGADGFSRWYYNALHENIRFARVTSDWINRRILVEYIPEEQEILSTMMNCFSFSGWETVLLREKRLILHASCVDSSVGGVLFSGQSGIGKSTQAELWCRYEDAKLINGDRPILYQGEDGWYGCGSPYAGSSKCFVNECCRVRAIVMLRQAQECRLRKLKKSEAFRSIFAQITVASWDPSCMTLACDLVEQLVSDITIYEFACTPDKIAVETLLAALQKGVDI